ncbi:heterokaryon incompatibility protein-domain-containing protein [Pisolithus marmoratus]|nr:heterokaryon incompatibility protein-domain-containing protein [Pisolithus marmoratus]
MRLLDVKAVLDREQSIRGGTEWEVEILKEHDDETTSYAILSHRWGTEVTYEEMTGLMEMPERKRVKVRQRDGYQKIIKSCELAMKDGYAWLWIDTCCIDKRSSAELSEAINSMYRWYQNAQVCYAYLNDVDQPSFPIEQNNNKFGKSNGWPEWFVRGWTLQELIAPKDIQFFNKDWSSVGNKQSLAGILEQITRIPHDILRDGSTSRRPSIAQVMSWAADRKMTRVEDRAYSLLGLFGVNMPMLYGEGKKAFRRLQLEILGESNDQSIFTWDPYATIGQDGSVLADDPSCFRDCHDIGHVASEKFIDRLLMKYVELPGLGNVGRIQMCLPLIPSCDSPLVFRAILACTNSDGNLVTIDLASRGSSFDRTFGTPNIDKAFPVFKTVYLTHREDTNEIPRCLTLDDTSASYHGFTRRGAFPRRITNDTVTLSSLGNDLIVIVYANDDGGSRFAVGLGNYLRQGWVQITADKCPPNHRDASTSSLDFAKDAYKLMWNARAEHSRCMPKRRETYNYMHLCRNFVKHAHFPRSIWAANVTWGAWDRGNLHVRVDVVRCPDCCVGPREWRATTNNRFGLDMPGLMKMDIYSHELEMGGKRVKLYECPVG